MSHEQKTNSPGKVHVKLHTYLKTTSLTCVKISTNKHLYFFNMNIFTWFVHTCSHVWKRKVFFFNVFFFVVVRASLVLYLCWLLNYDHRSLQDSKNRSGTRLTELCCCGQMHCVFHADGQGRSRSYSFPLNYGSRDFDSTVWLFLLVQGLVIMDEMEDKTSVHSDESDVEDDLRRSSKIQPENRRTSRWKNGA